MAATWTQIEANASWRHLQEHHRMMVSVDKMRIFDANLTYTPGERGGTMPGLLHSICTDGFNRLALAMPAAAASKRPRHRLATIVCEERQQTTSTSRRALILETISITCATLFAAVDANAVSSSRRALRSEQVPESEYKTLPSGLKYYDVKVGGGSAAVKGSRVAVHYVAKWKGITFMTSRQGVGVTGGQPYGFDIGASEKGLVLKGLDQGVEGMRVGGQRLLIVPPELAYGNKGIQEIPPNATIQLNVELLSIKQSPFGSGVKLIEG